MWAAAHGRAEIVTMLVVNGTKLNLQDNVVSRPLRFISAHQPCKMLSSFCLEP